MHRAAAWPIAVRPTGVLVILVVAAVATPTAAQSGHDHGQAKHDGDAGVHADGNADLVAGVSRDFLERPLAPESELSLVRHPIRGVVPEAVQAYEAGLTYHYLYHYLSAVRSFNEAIRQDPHLLAAYAGLSRALVSLGDRAEADAAVARGLTVLESFEDRSDSTSRLFLQLRAQAVSAGNDEERQAYREALDGAVAEHRADPELRMLSALNSQGEQRIERLNEVLELAPDHVGAHHELVHAYENRRDYEMAVYHGAILARLAPTVPHARHMYGHNLMRVGRVPDAQAEFVIADSLELAYFEREQIPGYYDWHHPHNLHLLALTQWHRGEVSEAEATFNRRARLPGRQGQPVPARLLELGELFIAEGRPSDAAQLAALILAKQDDGASGGSVLARAHLLSAESLLLQGRVSEAEAAFRAADEIRSETGSESFLVTRWMNRIELQLKVHQDEVAADDPRLDDVIEDVLRDRGPDGWITSLVHLHALARSTEVAGATGMTRRVLEAMQEHDPTFEPRIPLRTKGGQAGV